MVADRTFRPGAFARASCLCLLLPVLVILCTAGCKKKEEAPPPPPVVTVAPVQKETVPVYLSYIGSTASVRTVDIRARVEGFLDVRNFVEGDDVTEGQILYIIDQRPFEAALAKSRAQLAKDRAAAGFAKVQMERYRDLVKDDFVSREKYDDWRTQYEEAVAAVALDKAQIVKDELNLSWCTMYAPLDGRIGATLVHVGNLVGTIGNDTKLATIVKLDPIWVYFSPSVEDLATIRKYQKEKNPPVEIVLQDGSKHAYTGKLDFTNNQADQSTSTVALRAVVPNPEKTLLPGEYVTARLFLMNAPNTILVLKQAVSEDQRGTYVYIVDEQNKVEYRAVEVTFDYKKYRVVEKGLTGDEMVIIDGQQKVRAGMTVQVKKQSKGEAASPPADPAGNGGKQSDSGSSPTATKAAGKDTANK